MHRFIALAFAFAAVACGGGGSSDDPTATNAPSNPTSAVSQVAGARTQTPASPSAAATPPGTYEVVDGDTLSAIAERFGTTVEALVAANELASADDLQIGQVLKISATASQNAATTATSAPTATPTQ